MVFLRRHKEFCKNPFNQTGLVRTVDFFVFIRTDFFAALVVLGCVASLDSYLADVRTSI